MITGMPSSHLLRYPHDMPTFERNLISASNLRLQQVEPPE